MSESGGHVVLGATSEIGRAVALEIAAAFGKVVVAGRDLSELEVVAEDVRVRTGAAVTPLRWEATAYDEHAGFVEQCIAAFGSVDGVVACQGFMADQQQAADDWRLTNEMIAVNYAAAVSVLNRFANYFESRASTAAKTARENCYVCGVSSVAGDRGRQSNYLYGSTKAAFSAYLAGLRNRLHRSGVAVITVKPGFVDTSMTWGLLNADSPAVAKPARIARDTLRAIQKRKNVVYTPWFWRPIMLIIRSIPELLFKRLRL
jgi:decaprenylphospho-beta-D-erythro-pentofuranosid-2-ulose 2-reductase